MKMPFLIAGVCGAAAIVAVAAQQNREADRGPVSRAAAVLDSDHDGTISAVEIRNAATALRTLDTNGDGRIAADELRPSAGPGGPREGGPGRRGRGDEPGRGGASAATADELTDTLMAFDRNNDGRLERAEVLGALPGSVRSCRRQQGWRAHARRGEAERRRHRASGQRRRPRGGREGERDGGFGRGRRRRDGGSAGAGTRHRWRRLALRRRNRRSAGRARANSTPTRTAGCRTTSSGRWRAAAATEDRR